MFERFHGLVGVSLSDAAEWTTKFGHTEITSAHVVLSMAANERTGAATVLASVRLDIDRLADVVRSSHPRMPYDRYRHVPLDAPLKATLYRVAEDAAGRHALAGTNDLLLVFLDAPEPDVRETLSQAGISVEGVRTAIADYVRSGHTEAEPENVVRGTASVTASTPGDHISARFVRRTGQS